MAVLTSVLVSWADEGQVSRLSRDTGNPTSCTRRFGLSPLVGHRDWAGDFGPWSRVRVWVSSRWDLCNPEGLLGGHWIVCVWLGDGRAPGARGERGERVKGWV